MNLFEKLKKNYSKAIVCYQNEDSAEFGNEDYIESINDNQA